MDGKYLRIVKLSFLTRSLPTKNTFDKFSNARGSGKKKFQFDLYSRVLSNEQNKTSVLRLQWLFTKERINKIKTTKRDDEIKHFTCLSLKKTFAERRVKFFFLYFFHPSFRMSPSSRRCAQQLYTKIQLILILSLVFVVWSFIRARYSTSLFSVGLILMKNSTFFLFLCQIFIFCILFFWVIIFPQELCFAQKKHFESRGKRQQKWESNGLKKAPKKYSLITSKLFSFVEWLDSLVMQIFMFSHQNDKCWTSISDSTKIEVVEGEIFRFFFFSFERK